MKTFITVLSFFVLSYGGCEYMKYTGSEPVRKMCKQNVVGAPFSALDFLKNNPGRGAAIMPSVRSIADGKKFSEMLDLKEAKDLDNRRGAGVARITVSVGPPKRTCEVEFADGKINKVSLSGWWD